MIKTMKLSQLGVTLGLILLGGCASNQSVNLLEAGRTINASTNVSIEDTRPSKARDFSAEGQPNCLRRYGDSFIAPNKIAYLHHVVSKYANGDRIELSIDAFETLEYCDLSAKRAAAVATGAAVAAAVGQPAGIAITSYENSVLPKDGGDRFVLRLSGNINGKRFDVIRGFEYGSLSFSNFPSENSEYRALIAKTIDAAVVDLLQGSRRP